MSGKSRLTREPMSIGCAWLCGLAGQSLRKRGRLCRRDVDSVRLRSTMMCSKGQDVSGGGLGGAGFSRFGA